MYLLIFWIDQSPNYQLDIRFKNVEFYKFSKFYNFFETKGKFKILNLRYHIIFQKSMNWLYSYLLHSLGLFHKIIEENRKT